MRNKILILLAVSCIALIVVAGCSGPSTPTKTVSVPGKVTGTGDAVISFESGAGSHTFHITSTGKHAGMIVTLQGTKTFGDGTKLYKKLIDAAYADAGVEDTKHVTGFQPDTYILTVMTVNDAAPWSIEIT